MSDALNSETETRRCHACGTKVRTLARFCGNCGSKLGAARDRQAPALVGTTVADAYRIEGVLGTGSMGVVYRAEQIALRRQVALKVIGESADDETTRARFRREARAASQLNHPNVVQVYDFGQLPNGQPYLAMELLRGQTLEQLIDKEYPLDLTRVIRIQLDILRALQAAHDLGILHRDLKPANVFISQLPSGQEVAKVLDFGIATAMDGTLTGTQTWAPLTEAGFVCGTPAFMSPEQVQGFPLDQRSDLFSAAGLLYQMLTRERPFKGRSPVEVGANIVLKPLVPPSKARTEHLVTDLLDAFLLRAMAKQPEDRFAAAEDMIEALQILLTRLEGDTDPTTNTVDSAAEIGPTADWPDSLVDDDSLYPDTVVQAAVSTTALGDAQAKPARRRSPRPPPLPPRAPLPTPFADIDPAKLTPPGGASRRDQLPPERPAARPATSHQRPTLGRPSRKTDAPVATAGNAHSRAQGTPSGGADLASTSDHLKKLRRSRWGRLPLILFLVILAVAVIWLIYFSPWSAEFR